MSKKSEGILKKVGAALVIGIVTVSIGVLSFFPAAAIKSHVSTKYKYNPPAYVQTLMEDFDVSSNYLHTNNYGYYTRIEYNKDAPIYVSFSKDYDKYPEIKQGAEEALEYVFGIVNKINPNYRYKIVSDAERGLNSVIGRSTIEFVTDRIIGAGISLGLHETPFNYYDMTKEDTNYSSNKIVINPESLQKQNFRNQIFYVVAHELLHCFGFDDVYINFVVNGVHFTDALSNRKIRCDTFMDTTFGLYRREITPKDFATLCALYMPKLDETNYEEYKQKMNSMIDDYTKEYYKSYDELLFNSLSKYYKVEPENLKRPENIVSFKSHKSEHSVIHGTKEYDYNIRITNDEKYQIDIIDKDGQIVDSCSGEIEKTDRFLIFKDCYFKQGIMPGHALHGYNDGAIVDGCLFTDGNYTGIYFYGDFFYLDATDIEYSTTNNELDDFNPNL